MKKKLMTSALCVLGFGIVTGVMLNDSVDAQVKKGKSRTLTTHDMMEAWVKPHCSAVGKGLKTAPADDKAWKELALHAGMLNEAGHALMADDRCPDAVWAGAAKTLQSESQALADAIAKKDAEAASATFKKLTASCGACHKAHKK